jgi:hypothetical protein
MRNDTTKNCSAVFMKKLTLALVFVLISLMLAATFIKSGMANPVLHMPFGTFAPRTRISVTSPTDQSTSKVNTVSLTFTIDMSKWYKYDKVPFTATSKYLSLSPIAYYLDGKLAGETLGHVSNEAYSISVPLSEVSNGLHSVEVKASTTGRQYEKTQEPDGLIHITAHTVTVLDSSGIVHFTVDDEPPTLTVNSPENKTYHEANVQLTFRISEQASKVAYSLDGCKEVTISECDLAQVPYAPARCGNLTLTGLCGGSHKLVLYATDSVGKTGTSEIHFTIAQETEGTQTMSAASVAFVSVCAAAIGASALLFCIVKVKRHSHKPSLVF